MIAVVACGMRLQETLNMIKSAIVLNVNRHPLRFVVITEDDLTISFKEKVRTNIYKISIIIKKTNCFLNTAGRLAADHEKRLYLRCAAAELSRSKSPRMEESL